MATNAPAPAAAPARTNAHGIGKAWQGPTSTTRMAPAVLVAYWAYLASVGKPNARQQRHLARCAKYAVAGVPAGTAKAAAAALAQYSPGNAAAAAALGKLALVAAPAPAAS